MLVKAIIDSLLNYAMVLWWATPKIEPVDTLSTFPSKLQYQERPKNDKHTRKVSLWGLFFAGPRKVRQRANKATSGKTDHDKD